jgi:hypothetical protein
VTPPTRARRALLGVCLAVIVYAGLEAALWVSERTSARAAAVLWGASRVVPDARLGQRPNPRLPELDAAGWRNASRPQRAHAVAIGDSQTYGDEVAREDAWPQQLAKRSGREVYNLSLGGYGPVEYERLLDEALALSPSLVLVGFYAGNDLADAYLSAYPRALAPGLRSADPQQVERCEALDARSDLKADWERTNAARKGRSSNAFRRGLERFEDASRVLALLRAVVYAVHPPDPRDYADVGADDFDELRARAAEAGDDLLLPFSAPPLRTVLTPAARRAVVDTGDPRVEEGLRIGLEALLRMQQRCAEAGCRLAVVGIPSKELVFAERVRASGGAVPTALAELALRETLVWERIRAALAHAGVPLVDTLPQLRAQVASGRNPYRDDWNGHPIALGNAAIAEAVIAAGVLEQDPARAIP